MRIGARLDRNVKTVATHREHLTAKIDIHNVAPIAAIGPRELGEWSKPGAVTFKPFLALNPLDPISFSDTIGRMTFANRHSRAAPASAAINERHAGSSASAVFSQTVC